MVKAKRIALGMSGGVDSATAAALLMRAGHEVLGVTCLFSRATHLERAAADAAQVCKTLKIPHIVRDCTALFEEEVVCSFVQEYAAGLTPSPCVSCNAQCKIPALLEVADEEGCACVATGHYARVAQLNSNGRYVVKAALDTSKDQSYMLARLTQEQLARVVFPLGGTTKVEVRIMAEDFKLSVAQKEESQDICFIEGEYAQFLNDRGLADAPGDIVDRQGRVVGQHQGLFRYTIGQRKGIRVAAAEPYYVVGKEKERNQLVVGFQGETFVTELTIADVVWQAFDQLEEPLECMVKLRYRSRAVPCTVEPILAGARVVFPTPQQTTAPGQFAVFMQGETVLGSGKINTVTPA